MTTWIVVLLAGAVTLAIRVVPVAWLSSRPVPAWLADLGPLTAPVAFAALAASALAGSVDGGGLADLVPLGAAVVVAGITARRARSALWAVASGMAVLWGSAAAIALT